MVTRLGPWDTKGRRLLVKRLEGKEKQGDLAKLVGVSQPTVSEWKNGKVRPDACARIVLGILLGIPETAWLMPEENDAIARARRALASASLPATGTEG